MNQAEIQIRLDELRTEGIIVMSPAESEKSILEAMARQGITGMTPNEFVTQKILALSSVNDSILETTLRQLDQQFDLRRVYYPGSGFHQVPKKVLGENRVYHSCIDGYDGVFASLGPGHKVQADYRRSPFLDGSFDAALIWGIPTDSAYQALEELRRVTKNGGIIIDGSELTIEDESKKITPYLEAHLNRLEITGLDPRIKIYENIAKK